MMHCWKVIQLQREYGLPRLVIWSVIVFIIVFCFSYVLFSYNHPLPHKDDYFWVNIVIVPLIYPIHKYVHYFSLFGYQKSISHRLVLKYQFFPIIRMRLKDLIPKRRYIIALLAPFVLLNSLFIALCIYFPEYAHYASFSLAYHCAICLLDILYVKNLFYAPKNAIIEETPKGYEILVPPQQ